MLAISRRVNSSRAAQLIKLAERYALAIKLRTGVRRNIINGCIVEGRKSGENRTASVLELHGNMYMTGLVAGMFDCGVRDHYDPKQPSSVPALVSLPGHLYSFRYIGVPPDLSDKYPDNVGSGGSFGDENAVYRAHFSKIAGSVYLMLWAAPVGIADHVRGLAVSDAYIETLTGGFSARLPINTTGSTAMPIIAARGDSVLMAFGLYKEVGTSNDSVTQGVLFVMLYDTKIGTFSYMVIKHTALPERYWPADDIRVSGSTTSSPDTYKKARSTFVAKDAEILENGDLHIVFRYGVHVQDEWRIGNNFFISAADGWFSLKIRANGTVAIEELASEFYPGSVAGTALEEWGADPREMKQYDIPVLNRGRVHMSYRTLLRYAPPDPSEGFGVPPYSVDTLNGVPIATADQSDFGTFFRYPTHTNRDSALYRTVNVFAGTKAYISDTAIALRRGVPDASGPPLISTGCGVLFVAGANLYFENLADVIDVPISSGSSIYITCPQREIRDSAGKLVMPCTIIAVAEIGGVRYFGIRKGSVWPGDDDGKTASERWAWTKYEALTPFAFAAYYLGSPYVDSKYGYLFKGKLDD